MRRTFLRSGTRLCAMYSKGRPWSPLLCTRPLKYKFWIFRALALITVGYLVVASSVLGQSTGALSGTVEDASGQVVVGANLKLRNLATGQELWASSDEEGFFRFKGLAAGQYILTATQQGFKATELPVNIEDHADNQIRALLQVAGEVESVRVSAN